MQARTVSDRILIQYEEAFRANIYLSDRDLYHLVNEDGGKWSEAVKRRARELRAQHPFESIWNSDLAGRGFNNGPRYKIHKLKPEYFTQQKELFPRMVG